MAPEKCIEALRLIKELPKGKDAINQYKQSLTPKDRKMFNRLINAIASPFDRMNRVLECVCDLVYLLP